MPKIYEYMGITLFFYSNEHEPIHIHGKYQGKETKAEIHLLHGVVQKVAMKDKGAGLDKSKRKELEDFVTVHAEEIVNKWIDYFVRKKHITPQIITKKVKHVRAIGW